MLVFFDFIADYQYFIANKMIQIDFIQIKIFSSTLLYLTNITVGNQLKIYLIDYLSIFHQVNYKKRIYFVPDVKMIFLILSSIIILLLYQPFTDIFSKGIK